LPIFLEVFAVCPSSCGFFFSSELFGYIFFSILRPVFFFKRSGPPFSSGPVEVLDLRLAYTKLTVSEPIRAVKPRRYEPFLPFLRYFFSEECLFFDFVLTYYLSCFLLQYDIFSPAV